MNRHDLLKGFIDTEERFAFAKFLDLVENCINYHEEGFTDFLDPYKTEKFITALQLDKGFSDVKLMAFGGLEDSERKIIGVTREYSQHNRQDFPITALKITAGEKSAGNLTHRDFLGSVLGLGIDRDKVGDVLVTGDGAFVLVNSGIADYICANLSRVAHSHVEVGEAELDELYALDDGLTLKRVVVRSLRLDAVISAAYNISRSKSLGLISAGKVFINWTCVENPSKQLNIRDTVTVRGMGRLEISDISGNTKKGGIVLEIRKRG